MTTPSSDTVRPAIKSLRGRAIVVQVLLMCWVVIGIVAIAFSFMQRSLLERLRDHPAGVTLGDLTADSHRIDAINGVALGFLVATGLAFIVWFWRAYRNLDGLRATRRYGSGWAIGAWFCPIGNLFIPKRIADDLWQANERWALTSRSPMASEKSMLVLWWWGTWIGGVIVAWMTRSSDTKTLDDALTTNAYYLVRDSLIVAAAVLAWFVVQRISAGQAAVADRVSA